MKNWIEYSRKKTRKIALMLGLSTILLAFLIVINSLIGLNENPLIQTTAALTICGSVYYLVELVIESRLDFKVYQTKRITIDSAQSVNRV